MSVLAISFSKNRPSQLYSLLQSVDKFCKDQINWIVYWTCDEKYRDSYSCLKAQFPRIKFVEQLGKFDEGLIEILEFEKRCNSAKKVFFTPDDGLFIRDFHPINYSKFTTSNTLASMRLGLHLKKCHPIGNVDQKLPTMINIHSDGWHMWDWKQGEGDWGYPVALDTSIFQFDVFLTMIKKIPSFNSPTTLEVGLQYYRDIFTYGVCREKSCFVSLPWNAVTSECNNINGGISEEVFQEELLKGNKISVDHIYGSLPVSCHQEYELKFEQC